MHIVHKLLSRWLLGVVCDPSPLPPSFLPWLARLVAACSLLTMPRKKRSHPQEDATAAPPPPPARPAVAAHIRDRQRQVADREAARLARPDAAPQRVLAHADRKKSAVSSTPFGVVVTSRTSVLRNSRDVNDSSWCGPFAVAREMIAKREEAKRLREQELEEESGNANHPLDAIMEQVELEQQRKIHPSLLWKSRLPSNNTSNHEGSTKVSIYAKRQKRVEAASYAIARVPTLFQLVVDFVVDHFEDVETLGPVEHSIRTALTRELVAQHKLDRNSFQALLEPDLEALELIDCSQLPQDVLTKALLDLKGTLRYLVLDQCGRCFGPKAVESLQNNDLVALSIGGAYLLKDVDAARLIGSAYSPSITSLEFKACPLLGLEFCKALSSRPVALVELNLEDLTSLDESSLALLASSKAVALSTIRNLCLRRIESLNDELVTNMLELASGSLQLLDLSHNYHLTDATLAAIRKHSGGLRALSLNGLKYLTREGLEAFFLPVPGMIEGPPVLHTLELANLDHVAVTDEVVNLASQAASKQRDGDQGLIRLNVQGSTEITSSSCEFLVQTSSRTLQTLNLSFCPKVTDQGLGYLVQHCRSLTNLDIWGCAQVSDVFLDGHDRLLDSSLTISGAWIKKN